MRWCSAFLVLSACSFSGAGEAVIDARIDAAVDASIDAPIDAPVSPRVTAGLIGFWTFDEPAGTAFLVDTSGTSTPVQMHIIAASATLAAGNLVAATPARVISTTNNHLPVDCVANGGVTLEAWVLPNAAVQGSATQRKFIAGLSKGFAAHDVVLLQAGGQWVGQVRTTAALDGKPDVASTSAIDTAAMTHLVLVADANQRILYVNDVPTADPSPAPLAGWDASYAMAFFDEPQHINQWLGTLALVAVYDRALTKDEVHQNFALGADAP